jgi:hypothetical protein
MSMIVRELIKNGHTHDASKRYVLGGICTLRKLGLKHILCMTTILMSQNSRADQFHYSNVLVGARSIGMGGAFGAVADDASGVYYNPAGLAFALSNDISASANAFYSKKTTYLKTLEDEPFIEESAGSLSPFFGGLQKLDRYVPGLVFAFGVYAVDSDLKDQDTLIENKTIGSVNIERYHRTSNARANTNYAGAALGYRPMPNLALGFGLTYFSADELIQEYQDAIQTIPITGGTGWRVLGQNIREQLKVYAVQPILGFQLSMPSGFAMGLTAKKGFVASNTYTVGSETRTVTMTDAQKNEYTQARLTQAAAAGVASNSTDYKDAFPSMPLETRLAFAWFAGPTFLWAFDIVNYSAIKDSKPLAVNGDRPKYNREDITNFHTGFEWYIAPAFPIRFGAFTNYDTRPKVKKGVYDAASGQTCANAEFSKKHCGQPDHIDYTGASLFGAWVQPNSQISLGAIYQAGKGQAQKLGDHKIQDVKASSTSLAFSATHNL